MKKLKHEKKKWTKQIMKKINVKNKMDKTIDFVSDFFEIPKELMTRLTKLTVVENNKVLIEGYNQIIDYYDHYIKIKGYSGEIFIDGSKLDIKEISDSDLIILGNIYSINFKYGGVN